MKLHLTVTLNKSGKSLLFAVPLPVNDKVIELCKNDKVNVKITHKRKSISFIVKASKFGSEKNGDRRMFRIPNVLYNEVLSLCENNSVKVTIENRKSS